MGSIIDTSPCGATEITRRFPPRWAGNPPSNVFQSATHRQGRCPGEASPGTLPPGGSLQVVCVKTRQTLRYGYRSVQVIDTAAIAQYK